MKSFAAYLFDADGTIIDTRELIYRSFMRMGEVMGAEMPPRPFLERTVGLPVPVQLPLILGEGRGEAYYARAERAYSEYMLDNWRDFLGTFPGVGEGLAELAAAGKKLAVVTSRRRKSLELFLEALGLARHFSQLITPEDTARSKPDPEPARLAMRRLGSRPGETVFIGDAEYDICCGGAAGAATALVAWGGMDPGGWPIKPDFIAGSFADLLPEVV
ncbi:MAG: HAD-IA family hydrolase [Planctomycetota bacterium]|jgi:pyrophosphatase PpaX|nr:HAD-IA family hydrolase [Planctomycetota bacterium]